MSKIYKFFFITIPIIFLFENIYGQHNTMYIDSLPFNCASNYSVSVKAIHFKKIVGLQGTIIWETSVIKYSSINYGSSAITLSSSNMNLNQTANGILNYIWYDNDLVGQALPDSTILFTIVFSGSGQGKGRGTLNFSSLPTKLEIDTLKTDGVPTKDNEAVFVNGSIETPYFYRFIGSGNWDNSLNWLNNRMPPSTLPECSEIFVDPLQGAECLLNVSQTIPAGTRLTIMANKKFRILGSLNIK